MRSTQTKPVARILQSPLENDVALIRSLEVNDFSFGALAEPPCLTASCLMSISLRIATLSGKEVNIEIDLDSSVSDLMRRARDQLHAGIQCLISGSGVILDRWMTLSEASLNNEDTLRAMLRRAEVVPGSLSFALLRCDGRVVVWGDGKHSFNLRTRQHLHIRLIRPEFSQNVETR